MNNISWFPIVEFPLEKQLIHNGFLIYKESISTSDGELRVTRSKCKFFQALDRNFLISLRGLYSNFYKTRERERKKENFDSKLIKNVKVIL